MESTKKLKILVTGIAGMLGSKLFEVASEHYDVYGTTRKPLQFPKNIFSDSRILIFQVGDDIGKLLDKVKPNVVINCIGIVKSVKVPDEEMNRINGEFPKELASECSDRGIRMIQVSTDCVFSGKKGAYTEDDETDAEDAYGKSKAEGEVTEEPHLTIRTSIVGIEQGTSRSLISWFLSNPEESTIKGYTNAIWSGLSTRELSKILLKLAEMDVTGILHVSGEAVSKYELLNLFKKYLKHKVNIEPYDKFKCDRSLQHDRLDSLGIKAPSVEDMIQELAEKDL